MVMGKERSETMSGQDHRPEPGQHTADAGPPRPAEAVYPDGGRASFAPGAGPVVSVRFPDGVMVELRPQAAEAHWVARSARVQFRGLAVKGLPLDVDASVSPDGSVWQFSGWKTGVTGIDGGGDLPGTTREAALALCRRRARQAREAIAGIGGRRTRIPQATERATGPRRNRTSAVQHEQGPEAGL
jgi:hypothetical protein